MPAATPSTKCFTISQLARELNISTRSIRYYEEKGLISPQRTRGNQRVYNRRDRARLKLILRGKRFGYNLNEIAEMIGLTDVNMGETEQIKKSLEYGEKKLSEIRDRITELEKLAQEMNTIKGKLQQRLKDIANGSVP
ncbi:MAG: MerR family DNA-binding transcriptional regulator [Desulfobacteraceae bacterium]|nr:MerR family DNA-binding transcriptional regulator [Desulfobacteraceae bacterium]MBC2748973.1 MerR family DNA-binding transcriptional regulator [Desulfobacteraceae bacterium]